MIKIIRRTMFAVAATALAGLATEWHAAPAVFSLAVPPAHAIVGAPATPASVAGVARRSARRTAAVTSAAVVAAPVATGPTVAALPAGCAPAAGAAYYSCGGVVYRPYYQSGNVVYVASP